MVASGEQLVSFRKCTQVNFKLQKIPFTADFFVSSMESYGTVIGTQWLRTLGLIQWDFKRLQMHFELNCRGVILYGIANKKVLDAAPIIKLQKRKMEIILQTMEGREQSSTKDSNFPQIQELLDSYQDVL